LGPGQGATNHITGFCHFFIELNTQMYGQVKFSDESVTNIEGEHRTLTGVYYIPRLKTSILGIGQLDETGCRVTIYGSVLRVYDPVG
jgi:hypothetical protein